MKKKSLYIAGICAALSVGALGCASSAKAGDKENKPAVEDTKAAGETTAAETSESNTVIEKNASSGPASGTGKKVSSEFICVYGPVSEVTSDSVTIDNQSGISSAGEMVITFSPETPIFDAETGNPVDMTEAETGTVVYAYIGEAMTMSEPPITNGQLFFVHVTDVSAVPVYTEIESVKKSAENDDTVYVKAEDGVTYTISAETHILPYLTRNIVTADDLKSGKKCAIWADAEGKVSRLVLFQQ
ncbi:hypothetical protein [Clostridium fessum]|jgi:hypothetical protein|uniref:hypothetical protein n=1 Tax=Clostridium fessum TaxID=2126740 RepID=UPI0022DF6F8B|nr:hypothetical protein [Clostridium fessum]